jgi:tetratricopeptide (TPR) repeat protein
MKKFLLLLLVLGITAAARAEVKAVMDQLLQQVFILKPFIASQTSFSDPANSAQISDALKKMVALSKEVKHEERINRTGFQVSAAVLTQQLEQVENVFSKGNKDYALGNLRSTLGVCMSCHTQLPAVSTRFTTLNQTQTLSNPFQEAEFLFLIRNFDNAMTLYGELIAGYPLNKAQLDDIETAVNRQIFYYVRVARDLQALSVALQRDSDNQHLPAQLQKQIKGFRTAVDEIPDKKYPQFTNTQSNDLRKYAEEVLNAEAYGEFSLDSPQDVLAALKLSSVLYEYLNAYPTTPLKPDILYWLSLGERRYHYQSMYSLPDLYLKQCVLEDPKNPVAKLCFATYEESITVAFTGSGGTHIPPDIAKELNMMRNLVKAD